MKRFTSAALSLLLVLCLASCSVKMTDGTYTLSEITAEKAETINITAAADCNALALAKLKSDGSDAYNINLVSADEDIEALVKNKKTDAAVVSLTQAMRLYNETNGGIKVLAVNTGKGMSLLSTDTADSFYGLRGNTIYTSGENDDCQYILESILSEYSGYGYGIDVVYLDSYAKVVSAALDGTADTVLVPEPYVSKITEASDFGTVLYLGDEWQAMQEDEEETEAEAYEEETYGYEYETETETAAADETLPAAGSCVIALSDFIEENPDEISAFIEDYVKASEYYTEQNYDKAADILIEDGIFTDSISAADAIENCPVTAVTGKEMQKIVENEISVIYEAASGEVGGKLPGSGFCYAAE